jgi:hypothetical protein
MFKRLSPTIFLSLLLAALFVGSLVLSLSNLPSPIHKAHAASAANQFTCYKASYSPGALTTLTQTSTTITCPGVALGDICDGVSSSTDPGAGIILSCNVSAANTVRVQVFNSTAGTVTPPSANYTALMVPFYKSP